MESQPDHGIMFVAVSKLQATKQKTDRAWMNHQSQLDKPTALSVLFHFVLCPTLIQRDPFFYVAPMSHSSNTDSAIIIRSVF